MFTSVQVEKLVKSGSRVFTLFLPLIAGISIIVGGIVVANLMLMSVNDRRAEIGLRKAVGAKRRDISAQFLFESTVVTGLGGLLALGLGYVVLRAIGGVSSIARNMGDAEAFDDEIFGFHAQQAVEKALKAWLTEVGVTYPLTHDLSLLLAN